MMTTSLSESVDSGGLGPEYRIKIDGTNVKLVSTRSASTISVRGFSLHTLSEIFLPTGFPDSVTPDYIRYQIFDSLQAFSSSIAGLLSSRAVLEGFGVGDEKASSTNAVLLSVVQDVTGRLATILFAWKFGPALAPEAKMYRLAADMFNDSAFILDCLSPALPTKPRIITLCLAGALRAICGVCGGGAKAALSVHFARAGNVGELNAKDASQETVIGLLGMLMSAYRHFPGALFCVYMKCGSFVMSHITSRPATWTALSVLLTVHLVTNYLAVRAVAFNTFNRQRVNIAYGLYRSMQSAEVASPSEVSRCERIFNYPLGAMRDPLSGEKLGTCLICSTPEELVHDSWRETTTTMTSWRDALEVFRDEPYVLLGTRADRSCKILICFKRSTHTKENLKAWVNAFELCRKLASRQEDGSGRTKDNDSHREGLLDTMKTSLDQLNGTFTDFLAKAEEAGWNLVTDGICTGPVRTLDIEIDETEVKKNR